MTELEATEVTETCETNFTEPARTDPKPKLVNLPVLIVAVSCDAAARSIRPAPLSIGFGRGVLFEELPTGLWAVLTRADLICSGDPLGCSCLRSAAAPATGGVAMRVPWKKAKQ